MVLPSPRSVEYLSAIGVRGIVVHTGMLPSHEAVRWRGQGLAEMGLEKVAEFASDIVYKIPTIDTGHRLQLEPAIPDRLPAGAEIRLGVLARGIGSRPWSHPHPLGQFQVRVDWEESQIGLTFSQTTRLLFPLMIPAEQVSPVGISVRTPSSAGRYLLRLYFSAFDISTAPKIVELTTEPIPTSVDSAHLLSAAYS